MTTAGLGYVAWWGYSPALDLINLTGDYFYCLCKVKYKPSTKSQRCLSVY